MKTKTLFIEIVNYLFLFLFVYTAYSKFTEHERFAQVLTVSPHIGATFAQLISWFIPIIETVIAIILIAPTLRKIAMTATLGLMTIFTIYLIFMVASGSKLPCSCGGVISEMNWKQHIWFNISLIILAIISMVFQKKMQRPDEKNSVSKIMAIEV
jgi:uncharacterized membrane protein YphA (DoxX/SURF4 family)